MPDIKEWVTRPIGPLPAYGWVLVVVGGYFGYRILSGRSSSSTAVTAGATGTVPPTSGSDISGTIAPVVAPVTDPIAKVFGLLTSGANNIRLIDPLTGALVMPTQRVYELGEAIMTSRGPAHLVQQNGRWYALLDANFQQLTETAASEIQPIPVAIKGAVAPLPIKPVEQPFKSYSILQPLNAVHDLPVFGNNTAIPRPVALPTAKSLKSATIPAAPTFNTTGRIASQTLRIPAPAPKGSTIKVSPAKVSAKAS